MEKVNIVAPYDGIVFLSGGQVVIESVKMSPLSCGIDIDNHLDRSYIHNVHFWIFGLSPGQQKYYQGDIGNDQGDYNAGIIGIRLGRVDGVQISDSLFYVPFGIKTWKTDPSSNGPGGIALVQISNCQFDSYFGIDASHSMTAVTNCMFTPNRIWAVAIALADGCDALVNNCYFAPSNRARNIIHFEALQYPSTLLVSNCTLDCPTLNFKDRSISVVGGSAPHSRFDVVQCMLKVVGQPPSLYTKSYLP